MTTVENVRRLCVKSIDLIGQSHSKMDSLIHGISVENVRKNKIYSACASLLIVVLFCYIVASFFTSDNPTESNIPGDESSGYAPKFLTPFYSSPQ